MDMMKMFGKVKEVQAKMKEAQDNLVHLKADAESGGGMVKATVNGNKQLVALDIDKDLLKPEDVQMLQDLVVAAVNKAMEKIEEQIKSHLQKYTDGLLPNMPDLNF